MKRPQTRYAKVDESLVAYQVLGDGPIDLVHAWGGGTMEMMWEHPLWADFATRLATFSRLILFDPRGWGASDRPALDHIPTLEDWAEDLHAVLEATGSDHTAVFAYGFASPLAMIFAATNPERVSALIFFNSTARWMTDEDYPLGYTQEAGEGIVQLIEQMWGSEEFVATLLPSRANDERYLTWMAMVMRISASPRMAAAQYRYLYKFDARQLLHLIQAPTLVLHRKDSQFFPSAHGRFLAEHISGSRFVTVRGADEVPPTDQGDEILGHIEEFVTGVRPSPTPDRVLAAVLFTDIVQSTERAAAVGDRAWKELLQSHDMLAEMIIGQHQGRFVKSTGDGILAIFDGPGRAIRCARAFQEALRPLKLEIRMGLHTGEVELRGDDIGGIGVHVAARVLEHAGPGEVLTSAAVPMLVAGSGIEFDDRGEHQLKGVPGEWRLFAVKY